MKKEREICFTTKIESCPGAKLGLSFPCSGILLYIFRG